MDPELSDPLAVAQANLLLMRNLLQFLYISGKFKEGELSVLLEGSIASAEATNMQGAANVLRSLRVQLGAYEL